MSKSLELISGNKIKTISEREGEVFKYLKQSKYQDIPDEQINLLISYCRAAKLDPLSEVAHIVEYAHQDKDTKKWRKTYKILPGIAKFRIQAFRTGKCMGVKAPIFGPIIEEKIGSEVVRYPEWCQVVVLMLVNNFIGEFEATEYWLENYAKKSTNDFTPNKMWLKRPRAQLAKCAEAQAWRKAFPELLGGEATYEEMQGKLYEKSNVIDASEAPEYLPDVTQRIKNIVKSREEQDFINSFDAEAVPGEPEPEKEKIEEKEASPQLLGLFNMLKSATPEIEEQVNNFINGNNISNFNEGRVKDLIKKIIKKFPEIKRQLSENNKRLIDGILRE